MKQTIKVDIYTDDRDFTKCDIRQCEYYGERKYTSGKNYECMCLLFQGKVKNDVRCKECLDQDYKEET
jgi:hypothetical protein